MISDCIRYRKLVKLLNRPSLLFILSLFYMSLEAQQDVFKKYYSIDSSDNGPFPFLVETKSSYIYTSFYSGLHGFGGLGLRKIDKLGNEVDFKLLYPSDSFDVIVTYMKLISSNRILITGRNSWFKYSQMYAYMLLVDTNLNIIKQVNDSFSGYHNELYRELFYDYEGNLCTIHDEFTYSANPDSMHLSIRRINPTELTTTLVTKISGYYSQSLIRTSDSGFLIYTYSPVYEKKFYLDPIIIKFDKNWNKLWERNIGEYGKREAGGYGIQRLVELDSQYYCWRTSQVDYEVGFLYKLDNKGNIIEKWREKESSSFQTLIRQKELIISFGDKYWWNQPGNASVSIHTFNSSYDIIRKNYIGFREFYDTCSLPLDSTLYHMDAARTHDGGFLIFNWGSSYGARGKVRPYGQNFDILFKTDSCGFTQGDTCKIIPKIDSIVYNRVYISLDEVNNKVCGRRWHIDGKVLTSEKLVYSFLDTGTYSIGIWGFAGATVDSTSLEVRINKLDSCNSSKHDICSMDSDTSFIKCNQVSYKINKHKSKYCTRHWIIDNKIFNQDSVNYTFPNNGIYLIKLIGNRGVSDDTLSFYTKVECKLSLKPEVSNLINISPNPVTDILDVEVHTNVSIYMSNLLGQQVFPRIGNTKRGFRLDVRDLSQGIYILQLRDKTGSVVKTEKLIIAR